MVAQLRVLQETGHLKGVTHLQFVCLALVALGGSRRLFRQWNPDVVASCNELLWHMQPSLTCCHPQDMSECLLAILLLKDIAVTYGAYLSLQAGLYG